ncbi:thioredoxin-like 1-2, chloroplastic [Andrographis paniculata]|uniref:thioredoxin-like 1-2, chloroplastic n=1 Tax=Andrographis paniculata TaxID=175694 RepID=UPI0021E8C9A0|nr:thioredoxin-like 1-2, chloroplastic [Andrographis paniculata]
MSSCSLRSGFSIISGSKDARGAFRVCPSIGCSLQFRDSNSISKELFWGKTLTLDLSDQKGVGKLEPVYATAAPAPATVSFGKAQRWWEKSLQPNMVEIESAEDLVFRLRNSGDRLVIVDFYSPGCGGCRALHPKICQLAESNPDAIFLTVNYERHKEMCYALHVHVLPFFRFYRGADGRVCSFSCTNATIKKFKDALAKHCAPRCNLVPAKGLSEQELSALASIGQIPMDWVPRKEEEEVPVVSKHGAIGKDEGKVGLKEGKEDLVMV